MKHHKQHYKDLRYNGFRWFGFIDGIHHFSKKVTNGYLEMQLVEEDLENGNAEFMSENGLTS